MQGKLTDEMVEVARISLRESGYRVDGISVERAIKAALSSLGKERWKLMPAEPTTEMYQAFETGKGHITPFYEGYRAMYAAAPSPGEQR